MWVVTIALSGVIAAAHLVFGEDATACLQKLCPVIRCHWATDPAIVAPFALRFHATHATRDWNMSGSEPIVPGNGFVAVLADPGRQSWHMQSFGCV